MSRDQFVTYLLLGLILIAVLGVSWIITSNKRAGLSMRNEALFPVAAQKPTAEYEYDFTAMLPDTNPSSQSPVNAASPTDTPVSPVSKADFSSRPFATSQTAAQMPVSLPQVTGKPAGTGLSYQKNKSVSGEKRSTKTTTSSGTNVSTTRRNSSDSATQTGSQILDAYTPKQTMQQQKRLNEKLAHMATGLEQAIAKAILPKSKREQNLEKYMPKAAGEKAEMADSSPTAVKPSSAAESISQQLASQAQQVVGDMRRNYGDKAAGKASEIMNNFQQDMSSVLNSPNVPEEKMVQAQEVNNKYNAKLRRLNQEEARKKMEQELREENEGLLAQIRQQFNPDTETAARAKMEEYLQKRLEIMNAGYSEEESTKLLLELEAQQRKDIEKIVTELNPNDLTARSKWRQVENQYVEEQVTREGKDIEEGKKTDKQVYLNEKSLQEHAQNLQQENEDYLKNLQDYTPEELAQVQQILDRKKQQQLDILKQGGSQSEVNRTYVDVTKQANAELKIVQETHTRRMLTQQHENLLDQYAQQLQGLSPEAKEAWMNKAREVVGKYTKPEMEAISNAQKDPKFLEKLQQYETQLFEELQHISIE